MKHIAMALYLATVLCRSAIANPSCEDRTDLVAQCFDIRGRISVYNGTPAVRIWPVGTKRLLGVLTVIDEIGDEGETFAGPPILKKWVDHKSQIFSDLRVCPLTEEKAGHMRTVCIESARNIRVERQSDPRDKIEIIHVAGPEG